MIFQDVYLIQEIINQFEPFWKNKANIEDIWWNNYWMQYTDYFVDSS